MTVFNVVVLLCCMTILRYVLYIHDQVKRHQSCIDFLLKQWQESNAERLREAMENAASNKTR